MVLILDGSSENVGTHERKDVFSEKKSGLLLLSIISDVLNRLNNRDCSFRAQTFLNYDQIYLP